MDNSSSITNAEFDEAQQAIAGIAASVLSRPGYRLAVVNWGCEAGRRASRDGCRIDLATGSAIPGGWSTNPADFAYAGNNSPANKVCRSFGTNFAGAINRDNCGGGNFTVNVNDDYAQHALKVLEGALYSGGTTGGNDSYNQPTLGPSAPTQQLMLIHMTDADPNFGRLDGTSIREMPSTETGLGFYYYSNRFKNVRNAVIVGVGIDATATSAVNRGELGAFASRGGTGNDYDAAHSTAISTQAFDTGTPRIASYSTTYNATTILDAANTAFNATVPACVIVRKQSIDGTGSFSFTGGTNGLPASLTLSTATTNPQAATGVFLSQFNTPTSITETIPTGWALSSATCVNASNANVPVTSNLSSGLLTIPGSEVVAGAQLTCTFTNSRVQPGFGSCNARMFLDQVSTASSPNVSTLYNVGYLSSPFTYTSLGTGLARNGIGYNPLDNYIYGIEWDGSSGNELIRVGSDGSSVNLGVIAGLPVGNYSNGVISPAGDYYLTSGSGGATLYRVNIAARTATSISMSQSILVSDLAWYNGLLYGLSGGRLVSVNPGSGVVVDNGSTSPLGSAIAMWGFSNALLASGGGPIYAIDPATGAATLMSSAPAAGNADGANCASAAIQFPADLSVTKTNTPAQGPSDLANDTYVPGETRSYAIVVRNGGPFGAQNVTVSDPVPAGISAGTVSWTCAATSGGSVCGAASGSGALNDTGLNLPSGAVATYTVTMTVPTGFTGALTNTVTVTPPSNVNDPNPANNTATDTDQAAARVTLSKLSLGGVGAFSLSGSNGVAPQTLTTTVAGTAVSGTSQVLTTAGIATTLTEASPPAGYVLSAINCTGLGGGGTATPDLAARTVTLDAAATASGANITCTFTNSRIPLLRLQKALPSGRAAAADQFTLNMTGMAGLTTTGSGSTATGVLTHSGITIGNSYTLSESGAGATNLANYSSSYACTNALVGGQTPSGTGTSFSVTPVAGDDLTCTLTNTAILADCRWSRPPARPGRCRSARW
ncbi:DUF11 domain-containing protein [Rhodoferax koreensis]|uniref:DUF11 domain-containing protein n=1 Tax=Rhodoferax koreensis TaxID=1842727 RepID=UPI0012FFC632|nr:DUF11 domain-containing protein [Rhodoferax koreense]